MEESQSFVPPALNSLHEVVEPLRSESTYVQQRLANEPRAGPPTNIHTSTQPQLQFIPLHQHEQVIHGQSIIKNDDKNDEFFSNFDISSTSTKKTSLPNSNNNTTMNSATGGTSAVKKTTGPSLSSYLGNDFSNSNSVSNNSSAVNTLNTPSNTYNNEYSTILNGNGSKYMGNSAVNGNNLGSNNAGFGNVGSYNGNTNSGGLSTSNQGYDAGSRYHICFLYDGFDAYIFLNVS